MKKLKIEELAIVGLIIIGIIYFVIKKPPPTVVKEIVFVTNGSKPGVELIIKPDNSLSSQGVNITTDVNGIAHYTKKDDNDMYLKFVYPNTIIRSDRGNILKYSQLSDQDTINLYLYPYTDFQFKVNIKSFDDNTITNARINHPKLDFNVELLNDQYYCTIPREVLIENQSYLDDSIYVDISAIGYSSENITVLIQTEIQEQFDVYLKKGLTQIYLFQNSLTKEPLINLPININGERVNNTNTFGQLKLNYQDNNIGEIVDISVNKPGFINFSNSFELKPNPELISIPLDPIYINLNLVDSESDQRLEDLIILNTSNNKRSLFNKDTGKYTLYFPSINNEFSLEIIDPTGIYENKIFEFQLYFNFVGSTQEIKMVKKTKILLLVKDPNNVPLSAVEVYLDDKLVGKSNTSGKFEKYIDGSNNKIDIKLKKLGYYLKPEIKLLNPGDNHYSFKMETIKFGIQPIDFRTKEIFTDLNIDNSEIVHIDKSSSSEIIWLQFPTFGKYDLFIMDRGGEYQDTRISITVNEKNIQGFITIDLFQITFIKLFIKDDIGKPISNVFLKNNVIELGTSNVKGKIRKKITYNNQTFPLSLFKPHYFDIDTLLEIQPGENEFQISMKTIPQISLLIRNRIDNLPIPSIPFKVNGELLFTNNDGKLMLQPESIETEFELSYNDQEEIYFTFNRTIKYDPENNIKEFFLDPIPYIQVSTYFSDNTTAMGDVIVMLNNQTIGRTNENGKAIIKIPEMNEEYQINLSKDYFEMTEINITPTKTLTEIDVSLKNLVISFYVEDIFNNPISDINVNYRDENNRTDEYGKVDIYPKNIGEEIKLRISSPTGIFKDTVFTQTFLNNGKIDNIKLKTEPLLLDVIVRNKIGIPGKGKINIKPPPNNFSEFELNNEGKCTVEIYKSGNYFISYYVKFGSEFVTDIPRQVSINIGDKMQKEVFTIKNAKISIQTDNSIPVEVKYIGKPEFTATIKGDGFEQLSLPNYGQYEFVFTPIGWIQPIKEIKTITKPYELFSFMQNPNYQQCIEAYNDGDFENAKSFCDKVDEGDPNYCRSLEKKYLIYRDNWFDFNNARIEMEKYIHSIDNGYCEENTSFYLMHIDAATKIEITSLINIDTLETLWKHPDSKIKQSFDNFSQLCKFTGSDCDQKEENTRLKIIDAMSNVMCHCQSEYENNFDIDESMANKYINLNQHLYQKMEDYFIGLPASNLSKYKSKRNRCKIN